MNPEEAPILSHFPNSGIVHLPGRTFPGIVLQGDSLSNLFEGASVLVQEFKRLRDEEHYYEALIIAERLQEHLLHYEEVLEQYGFPLPYGTSVHDRLVSDDFDSNEVV